MYKRQAVDIRVKVRDKPHIVENFIHGHRILNRDAAKNRLPPFIKSPLDEFARAPIATIFSVASLVLLLLQNTEVLPLVEPSDSPSDNGHPDLSGIVTWFLSILVSFILAANLNAFVVRRNLWSGILGYATSTAVISVISVFLAAKYLKQFPLIEYTETRTYLSLIHI